MERYEIVKDIGSGNFGVAKLVSDRRTRELFAVKFIERGQKVQSLPFLSFFFFFFFFFFILCRKFDGFLDMIAVSFSSGLLNS